MHFQQRQFKGLNATQMKRVNINSSNVGGAIPFNKVGVTYLKSDELIKRLEKQERQMNMAHKTELKNVKNLAIRHSIDFVKDSAKRVTQIISKEHRHIAREFLKFRNKTFDKMEIMD